jgi:hypothetical protein
MVNAKGVKFCNDRSTCWIISNVANDGAARIGAGKPSCNISCGSTAAGADAACGITAEINLLWGNVYAGDDIEHYIADT